MRRDAAANQERLVAAAVSAVLREGRQVPMATIAAEAGVGVATLYRRYPNREALLDALTVRSFAMLAELAAEVEDQEGTGLDRLDSWWDRVIDQRHQLVLPFGGGPHTRGPDLDASRSLLHERLQRILAGGQKQGSIRPDVGLRDIIVFGAMLITPLPGAADWDATARRQKEIHLDGLAGPAAGPRPTGAASRRRGRGRSSTTPTLSAPSTTLSV